MNRPTSPHLTIYRPQWTSVLSIFLRATGLVLVFVFFAIVFWIWSLTNGYEIYMNIQEYITSWYGQLFLIGWTFSFFFYLAGNIRHLMWDIGFWLDLKMAYLSGVFVFLISVALTALTWFYIWFGG